MSFFNPVLILAFFLYLLINACYSLEIAIKGLILIAIRTIINPSIAINIDSVQLYKWMTIFLLCFIILIHSRKHQKNYVVSQFVLLETFFCVYIFVISAFNSSYPIVSMFKCFSYGFVFISIIIGVSCTKDYIEWSKVLYHYITVLMIGSIIIAPLPISYYSDAHWFMGATNHSQMFGIMAAIYSALVLCQMMKENRSFFQYIILVTIVVLSYNSGSRTGLIATLICLLYGYYVEVFKNKKFSIFVISVVGIIVLAIWFAEPAMELFREFILKNNYGLSEAPITLDAVTASRKGQYDLFLQKFNSNRWLGAGFMVPFLPGVQDWSFSFGLIVENGNLFYSVLGDLGIIGLILFIIVYGFILVKGQKRNGRFILYITPFLVCMGEMIFFSTNNNAIILYVMLAEFLGGKDELNFE